MLQESGWAGEHATLDGLAAHLRAYGPKRQKETEATPDGELVTAKRALFRAC